MFEANNKRKWVCIDCKFRTTDGNVKMIILLLLIYNFGRRPTSILTTVLV